MVLYGVECSHESRRSRAYHPQQGCGISSMRSIVYHQAAGKYTLARDEIQGRGAALDDIHDCVVMICQACGLDKKRSNFCLSKVTSFLSMGYKKDILGSFAYEFELLHKSRRSRVYHQNEVLHIINSAGIVYHHCESTIQPTADDIHLR